MLDGPLPPLAIPTTLHASLVARLDRLATVKDVAQIGAAIGRVFSHQLIAAVSSLAPMDLDAALERLTVPISSRGAERLQTPLTPSSMRWCRMPPTSRCSKPAAAVAFDHRQRACRAVPGAVERPA